MDAFCEKAKAVVIGHAVGDALGVPVEFFRREALELAPVTDMSADERGGIPAGSWSDDTSMSACALDGMAGSKIDYDKIMRNFVAWLTEGKFTPGGVTFGAGNTCVAAIGRYLRGMPYDKCGLSGEYDNGNGSLMRIHPFVLHALFKGMSEEEMLRLTGTASSLTHAHPRSVVGCQIYALVLSALLSAPEKQSIGRGLKRAEELLGKNPEFAAYRRIFRKDFAALPRAEIRSGGYVVDTLEAALWCLFTTDSYPDCVLAAVNLGEDTDTTGAVAGGLAGALYGYEAVPARWRNALLKRDSLENLCARAFADNV